MKIRYALPHKEKVKPDRAMYAILKTLLINFTKAKEVSW
jgi:hypothetical protein